jgi:Flavin containing amine oxidoreductase
MGLLDKVILVYEIAWWAGTSPSAMGNILIPSKDDPTRLLGPTRGLPPSSNTDQQGYSHKRLKGSFPIRTPAYLEEKPLLVFDLHAQCGIPTLCIFVSGEFGDVMELCEDSVTTEWATGVVEQWLGGLKNGGGDIPKPVEVFRTAWRKNENAYGSYAYIPVGGFHDGVDVEVASVEGRREPEESSLGNQDTAASPLDQLELSRTMWGRCFGLESTLDTTSMRVYMQLGPVVPEKRRRYCSV